jgi:hypothetical protein
MRALFDGFHAVSHLYEWSMRQFTLLYALGSTQVLDAECSPISQQQEQRHSHNAQQTPYHLGAICNKVL